MNLDFDSNSFLVGSEKQVLELSKKSSANILVISDTHGYQSIINSILENQIDKVDLIIFCGDGVNDIISFLENVQKTKFFQKKKNDDKKNPVIVVVQGNGDESSFKLNFNINENPFEKILNKATKNNFDFVIQKTKMINVASKNILITHGHLFGVSYGLLNLQEEAFSKNADLVLFGHTHVAEFEKSKNVTFINPGSPSLPRRNMPPSFAVVKIDSSKSEIDCVFYKVDVSLSNGISFSAFFPNSY